MDPKKQEIFFSMGEQNMFTAFMTIGAYILNIAEIPHENIEEFLKGLTQEQIEVVTEMFKRAKKSSVREEFYKD